MINDCCKPLRLFVTAASSRFPDWHTLPSQPNQPMIKTKIKIVCEASEGAA